MHGYGRSIHRSFRLAPPRARRCALLLADPHQLERHYDSAAFLLSESQAGLKGDYTEPAADLAFQKFAQSLAAQVAAFSGRIKEL